MNTPQNMPQTPQQTNKDKKLNKILLWAVIINVILWTTLAILLVYTQDEPNRDPEYLAYTMARMVILDQLKAPSTAKFQPYDEAVVIGDGQKFQVTIWVEAENSFGVPIRTRFTAMIEYDGKNYKLLSLRELS